MSHIDQRQKGYALNGNQAVSRMKSLYISGNVIPIQWFRHIKRASGKPYDTAILLLADVVYWYRPIEIRDEASGQIVEYRKKFKADLLQRSYDMFAELYGYTKDQVRDALTCLEQMGLIQRDLRTVRGADGIMYNNVLFIGLNVDALEKITYPLSDLNPIGVSEEIPPPIGKESDRLSDSFPPPIGKESETYTETTTETPTETTQKEVEAKTPAVSAAASGEIWRAFQAAGIGGNQKTKKIAEREGMSAEYILAHYLELKRQGKGRQTSLLVSILDQGFPAPPLPPDFCRECWQIGEHAGSCSRFVPPVEEDPETDAGGCFELPGLPEPSALEVVHAGYTLDRAWQAAKTQLEMELPKLAFMHWLEPTRVLRYDQDLQLVTIQARDQYDRDWLDSRVKSRAVQLLTGMLNRRVDVEFAVAA